MRIAISLADLDTDRLRHYKGMKINTKLSCRAKPGDKEQQLLLILHEHYYNKGTQQCSHKT